MELSFNVIALVVCGVISFASPVSGEPTQGEVITYSVLGTIGVEIVIGVIAFFIWKKCKAKKKKDSAKPNTELHGHDNGAYYTSPDVSSAEQGLGPYENKREYPRTAKINSPSHSTSPNEKSWNSLPQVQFAGPNLPRHGSYASLDNNINSQDPEIVSVNLQSQDFIGLGFNISGSMRDGIFISEVHNRGPAIESGVLKVGDRILSVTISFENMVFEDALTILSYASPYPVNICVQKYNPNKISGSYKANGFEMQLNHPLYRSQSLDALTRMMKDTLPKRSYSELKSDNKKDNSFVKQPNFIKDISSTMKDLSSSRSGTLTTNDDDNDRKREIPAFSQISEVVIHNPPTVTDVSVPLKEESYFNAPTLEKNRDLKESIRLREPYKLHVYENIDYTETLESTPKPGSNIKFPMFDSDDSISKLDEQMDIHFSNCDKEFEDLKQKADEDNFKLNLDLNAEKAPELNSPNSETEFENLEKKIELSSNYADIFDPLSENSKFPELNMSFDDFPSKYMESTDDNAWTKSNTESNDTTDFFFTPNSTNLMSESDINAEKVNNSTLDSTDFFLSVDASTNSMTESSISIEKENLTDNMFNSNPSDVSTGTVQNLLLKSNEEDGLLILPTRVEDKMREDCLEKLLPKSLAEEKKESPDIKDGEIEFDKYDSPKVSTENLKDDNESELLSLKNGGINLQSSAFKYEVPLPAADLSIPNSLYSVEKKVEENTLFSIENKVEENTPFSIENNVQENTLFSVENSVQENTLFSVENKVEENTLFSVESDVQENLKDDNESELFSLKNGEVNLESSAFKYEVPLPASDLTIPNSLYSVEKKVEENTLYDIEKRVEENILFSVGNKVAENTPLSIENNVQENASFSIENNVQENTLFSVETDVQETLPDLLKESPSFAPAIVKSPLKLDSVDSLFPMTKDDVDISIWKSELSPNEITSSELTPEETSKDFSSPFFKFESKEQDVGQLVLNPKTETAQIKPSIFLQPEVNADNVNPFSKMDDTNSSSTKYELKMEGKDVSFTKPEILEVDSSVLNQDTETAPSGSFFIKSQMAKTDVADALLTPDDTYPFLFKYKQKTGKIDSSLLKLGTQDVEPSILNTETEPPAPVDFSISQQEDKTVDFSLPKPEIPSGIIDKISLECDVDTDSSLLEIEKNTEDIGSSLLKSKTHSGDSSILNTETDPAPIDFSTLQQEVKVVDPLLMPDRTDITLSKYEPKTVEIDTSLLKSETNNFDPSILNTEIDPVHIDSSIVLPEINTKVVDPILTPGGINSRFSKYERKTVDIDASLSSQQEDNKTDIDDQFLPPKDTNSSFLKYELKMKDIDPPLLEPETHSGDSSILNAEPETVHIDSSIVLPEIDTNIVDSILVPDRTDLTFSKYERKTEEIDTSLLKPETNNIDPSILNTETDSINNDSSIVLPEVNRNVVDPILMPDSTDITLSKYEPKTVEIDTSLLKSETPDSNPSILNTITDSVQIDSSIVLPEINTNIADPILTSNSTDSSFLNYEQETKTVDFSLPKPEIATGIIDKISLECDVDTDSSLLEIEKKTEDIGSSLLKSEAYSGDSSILNTEIEPSPIDFSILQQEVKTDFADPILTPDRTNITFSKYEPKSTEIDSSLLKSDTYNLDPSILNIETETVHNDSSLLPEVNTNVIDPILKPGDTDSSFLKYEQETEKADFSLPKPEISSGSVEKIPLECDVDTSSSFLEIGQKMEDIGSSLLKPGNNTDSVDTDPSDYEVKTDEIKISLLTTDEVKTIKTDLPISTPDLEQIQRERHTSSSSDNDEDVTAVKSQAETLKPEALNKKATASSHSSGSSSESDHDEHTPSGETDKQQKELKDTETTPSDSTVLKPEINTYVFGLPLFNPNIKKGVLPSASLNAASKDSVLQVEKKILFTEPAKLDVASTKHSTSERSELSIPKLKEEERQETSLPIQKTDEQIEQRTSGRSSPYKYHLKAFDMKDISLGAENPTIQTSNISSRVNHPEKREPDQYYARPVNITPPKEPSLTKSILKPKILPKPMSLNFAKETPNKETEVSQNESITQVKTFSEESSLESESEEHKSDETTDNNKEKSHIKLTVFKRIPQKGSTSSSSDSDEDATVSKKSLEDSFLSQSLKAESVDDENASTHSSESSFETEYTVNPEEDIEQPQRDTTPTPSLDHPNDSGEQEGTADEEEECQDKKDEAFFEMTEDELSTDTQSLSPKSAVTRAISCDGGFVTSDDSDLSKPRSDSINQEIQLPEDNYIDWSGQSPVRTESFSQLADSALVWTGTDLTEDGKAKTDTDSDDSNNEAVTQTDVYKPRENLTQLSLSNSSSSISSNETKTNGERGNDSGMSFDTMDLNFSRPPFSESNHKTDLLRPREDDNKMVNTNYEGHGAFTVTFSTQTDTDA